MACVYLITSPSGKQYVGMTRFTAEKRFAAHVRTARFGAKNTFSKAIRKYGEDSFSIKTLLIASREYCAMIEPVIIAAYGTRGGKGYNEAPGGEGGPLDGERLAMRNASIAKFYATPAGKEVASKRAADRWATPGAKERASERAKEALGSDEVKRKLSDAQKRAWADPVEREKRSSGISAAFADPSVKAKLIEAQKRGNSDPAVKARKSEIMRQRMADPEVKRRTVERMLAARGIKLSESAP